MQGENNVENKGENMEGGRKLSAWNKHVKSFQKSHKNLKGKALFKAAAKTFKKTRKGGASINPYPLNGAGRGKTARNNSKKGKGYKLY